MSEHGKNIVDVASTSVVVGTLTAWLPPIAALLSIIWTLFRLIEMFTGKTISQILSECRLACFVCEKLKSAYTRLKKMLKGD